jgi:hypothetical protein
MLRAAIVAYTVEWRSAKCRHAGCHSAHCLGAQLHQPQRLWLFRCVFLGHFSTYSYLNPRSKLQPFDYRSIFLLTKRHS